MNKSCSSHYFSKVMFHNSVKPLKFVNRVRVSSEDCEIVDIFSLHVEFEAVLLLTFLLSIVVI